MPALALAQLTAGVQTYSVSGRSYDVTTPSDYNPTKEYPIVFELHSFNKDRTQMNDPNVINEQQYISVRPEGTSVLGYRAWNSWSATKSFLAMM
ncbi:hypothetical protein LEQ04_04120 [Riemerella anatipestifer]|nr:hypothetical protein LEQ03_07005 [Riemerella anatipestifer]WPC16039.1 hypothetical protein LEQ04_04120 [Riemerella anatipestifer]